MKKIKRSLFPLVTVLCYILLVVAVVLLMRHVQQLLYYDVQINLIEVVTQNKDVITSKLKMEVNNLELSAKRISDQMSTHGAVDAQSLQNAYRVLLQGGGDDSLYISDKDGNTCMSDGSSLNIAGRRYFRYAMDGISNISDRVVSRLDGRDVFVVSVPIYVNNQIVGTMQRSYTPEEMYSLCKLSLYSSQGYMYIINSEGYILVSSRPGIDDGGTNYFRALYADGNTEAFQQIQKDIAVDQAGFMEAELDGQTLFSAYTPIEEVHNWYLISSIATDAVFRNASIVIKMFYLILFVVATVFSISMLYFLCTKRRQQEKLAHIAFVDNVTQGNTYNKFVVDLRQALGENPKQVYYLLTFDIDNFKYVNNFYGFDCGDRILRQIEQSIRQRLLPKETIARISGDHFVVLLTNAEEDRLNDLLEPVTSPDGVTVYLTGGLYALKDCEESINLMVDKAESAAESAKSAVHKRVEFYSEQFELTMIHNEQMKRAVQEALQNNEFVAFYQPKIDISNGSLVGAEALARWRSKDGKLISPFEFIPLCEKTGLVVDLDLVIFDQVLHFLRECLDAGIHCVPISVNFSRLHLANADFVDTVAGRLAEYRVPPELIELELTESVIFDNHDIIYDFISRLHEKGMRVSMDDFGSGYSSLNMLKDVPIDVLKIDKEFLKETNDNSRRDIIFSTIAQMANMLRITVVVEGVETLANVELMRSFDCQVAQGYYFARPMEQKDFIPLFQNGRLPISD